MKTHEPPARTGSSEQPGVRRRQEASHHPHRGSVGESLRRLGVNPQGKPHQAQHARQQQVARRQGAGAHRTHEGDKREGEGPRHLEEGGVHDSQARVVGEDGQAEQDRRQPLFSRCWLLLLLLLLLLLVVVVVVVERPRVTSRRGKKGPKQVSMYTRAGQQYKPRADEYEHNRTNHERGDKTKPSATRKARVERVIVNVRAPF